jgi:hypothetical protein
MTDDHRGDSWRDLAAAGGSRPFGYNGIDRNDGEVEEVIIGVGNGQFYLDVWDGGRSSPGPRNIHVYILDLYHRLSCWAFRRRQREAPKAISGRAPCVFPYIAYTSPGSWAYSNRQVFSVGRRLDQETVLVLLFSVRFVTYRHLDAGHHERHLWTHRFLRKPHMTPPIHPSSRQLTHTSRVLTARFQDWVTHSWMTNQSPPHLYHTMWIRTTFWPTQ